MSETHTLLSAALGKLHSGVLIIDRDRHISFFNHLLLDLCRHFLLDFRLRTAVLPGRLHR